MQSPRKVALFLVLSAGCSAGAVAGTGAPGSVFLDAGGASSDAARTSDAEADPDEGLAIGTTDSGHDAGKDSGSLDAAHDADATAVNDSATDAADAADAGNDAHANVDAADGAPKDAAADVSSDAGVCSVDDGTWVASSSQYHIVAKGSLWRLDAAGGLVSTATLASIAGMAQGPCLNQVGTCHIDAMTWRNDLAQYHIVTGGKLWRLDDHGALLGSTVLTNFSGIASGPCLNKVGAACTFEAGAWRDDLSEYELVVDGVIYGVTEAGVLTGSRTLLSIAGVAAGPCAGQVGTCHVEGFTYRPDTAEYHVIAKGSLYVIDATGALLSTTPLTAFSGLANGPCK